MAEKSNQSISKIKPNPLASEIFKDSGKNQKAAAKEDQSFMTALNQSTEQIGETGGKIMKGVAK